MNPYLLDAVLVIAGYLIGGIPFAVIVAKAHGVDIFKAGSGNPGATNVGRVLGGKWGVLVFGLDVFKGLFPVLLARLLCSTDQTGIALDHQGVWALVGFAAVAGHITSPYLGFRGGKGVATAVGAVLGISPLVAGSGFAVFLLVLLIPATRYVSLASVVSVLASIPLALLLHEPPSLMVMYVVASLLIVYRHRGNMKRLAKREEPKFQFKKKPKSASGQNDAQDHPVGEPQDKEPGSPI
jgi:glycerol-3-phosphate acyltransferase PlsY